MSTAAQILANQTNAQFSTGPRSSEGKAASAQNSRKHGFRSATLVLGPDDQPAFDQLAADFQAQYTPQSPAEQLHLDHVVVATWKQRQLWAMESAWLTECTRRWHEQHPERELDDATVLALVVEQDPKQWDRYQRYSRDLERQFHRGLKALDEARAQRAQLERLSRLRPQPAPFSDTNEPKPAPAPVPAPLPVRVADTNEANSAVTTYRRETPKVGRNEPCPCASGRKYKYCCGK